MERVSDRKQSTLTNLMEFYQLAQQHSTLKVFPQMPTQQIQYFIKQAARRDNLVTIQLNNFTQTKDVSEVTGKLSLSPHSSHIILAPVENQPIHLIQPKAIRHVRL